MSAKKENKLPWQSYSLCICAAFLLSWIFLHTGTSQEAPNAVALTNSAANPTLVKSAESPDPKDGEIAYEDLAGKIVPVSKFNAKTRQYEPLDLVLTEPSYNKIDPKLVKLAESGNPAAQWRVGEQYYEGEKVRRNYGEAAKWWVKAADQGYISAQLKLSECYLSGKGVPLDRKKGVKMLQLILEKSEMDYYKAVAMYRLAYCCFNGFGIPKNIDEGAKWLRKSAETGFSTAQHDLGNAYLYGLYKIPKDEKQGKLWLKRSKESEEAMERAAHEASLPK